MPPPPPGSGGAPTARRRSSASPIVVVIVVACVLGIGMGVALGFGADAAIRAIGRAIVDSFR
jgi:hypothetical protein